MLNNQNIPLIRAAVTEPLLLAAKSIGTPVETVIHKAGLPVKMLDYPDLLIPEIPAWHLLNSIYQMEGEPLFGVKVAMELAPQNFKTVEPLLKGCLNLKSLLERFINIVPMQTNAANYTLINNQEEHIWFSQRGPRLIDNYQQIELFEVAGMIQLVQLVAGKQWRPAEIHFSFNDDKHIDNSEHLNPSRIFFSKPHPAIAIPKWMLAMKVPEQSEIVTPLNNEEIQPLTPSIIPTSYRDQLLTAMEPLIGGQKLTPSVFNKITGTSFRTLQRKLSQENTSYSEVLDQARYQKSQFLLKKTNKNLLDISIMLGYANASAFTRAFKQWTGITPIEFRKSKLNI